MANQIAKKGRLSLFWIFTVLMVIIVAIPLISYSVKSIIISKKYIEETVQERLVRMAIPAADRVTSIINNFQSHLDNLKASFEIYSAEQNPTVSYEDLLEHRILNAFLSDDCLALVYTDNKNYWVPAQSPLIRVSSIPHFEENARKAANAVMNTGSPYISEVYYLSPGIMDAKRSFPYLLLAKPVIYNGKPVSVVVGLFLLNGVQNAIQQFSGELGANSKLFIIDQRYHLVAHSDGITAGDIDFSNDPVVAEMLKGKDVLLFTQNRTFAIEQGGKRVNIMVSVSPIASLHWLLFAVAPEETFLGTVRLLTKQSIIWVLVSIIMAIIIGVGVTRFITKPLEDLAGLSSRLALGDFSTRAKVGVKTEISDLAESFNKMADDIQNYIKKVELASEENKMLFMSSIRSIANAIDAKDPYTRGHSERVSEYSIIIAKEFGFSEEELRVIEISSLLHDVGKIGIEDKILRKPGALTNDEYEIMKTHPVKGDEILGTIKQMKSIIPGIRHHHEKWAGGGYPDGLKGQAIPVMARIVGVADTLDAMTTNRPYQRAMTFQVAAARINELSNTVYDPAVVMAFNTAFRKGLFNRQRTVA